jgi:hypothetical protein
MQDDPAGSWVTPSAPAEPNPYAIPLPVPPPTPARPAPVGRVLVLVGGALAVAALVWGAMFQFVLRPAPQAAPGPAAPLAPIGTWLPVEGPAPAATDDIGDPGDTLSSGSGTSVTLLDAPVQCGLMTVTIESGTLTGRNFCQLSIELRNDDGTSLAVSPADFAVVVDGAEAHGMFEPSYFGGAPREGVIPPGYGGSATLVFDVREGKLPTTLRYYPRDGSDAVLEFEISVASL